MKLPILLLSLATAVSFSFCNRPEPAASQPLTLYCAAGLRKPVETIAEQYRRETGIEIRLQYGPTGALLSNLRVARQGDLFLAADDGSIADARKFDVIREVIPLVRQHPVIAVRTGNPKGIKALADLLREDVRVALPNPETASIGRVSRAALGEAWAQLAAHAAVMKSAVTEVASDLSIGSVDAAILWDATVLQFKGLETVETPELKDHAENASAAILTFTRQPESALKLAHYLAAPDKGGEVFQRQGFTLANGEKRAAPPPRAATPARDQAP